MALSDILKRRYTDEEEQKKAQSVALPDWNETAQGSGYKQKLNDLDTRIANYTYQQYVDSDDYASLVKRYSKQGLRAMDDTLGKVAARTGGIASSYATTAGQQAYGGYMQELESMARDMYDTERKGMIDERSRLYDEMQTEREYNTDMLLKQLSLERDYEQEQYDRDKYNEAEQYDRDWNMAKLMAQYGDYSGFGKLGMTDDQIARMQGAAGGVGSGGIGDAEPKLTASQVLDAIEKGITTDEVLNAYQYYYGEYVPTTGNEEADNDAAAEDLYNKVYDAIVTYGGEKGSYLARKIPNPDEWANNDMGYRSYEEFLQTELKKLGIDISGFIKQPEQTTTPTTTQQTSYTVDEYLSTIQDLYNAEGRDTVMDAFGDLLYEKPDDLTMDEWEKLITFLKTMR